MENNQDMEKIESSIEDNLPMVSYIMLHRIYDLLSLIASKVAGSEDTGRMVDMHSKGFLLGPEPAYTPSEGNPEA
jgi:hypothetical protein